MSFLASLLRPELSTLAAYVPKHVPSSVVRLDANESPLALRPHELEAVQRAFTQVQLGRYPDVRANVLRTQIANTMSVHPDSLVLGCGSDEVIALLLQTLAAPRANTARPSILIPTPTFVMYANSARSLGWDVHSVPLDATWDLDLDAMLAALREHKPSIVFLASPNNPTANVFSRAKIQAIVEAAQEQTLVVLDEAYGPFASETYGDILAAHPHHVARMQTLSKVGFAALRVGWAALPLELAQAVDKVRLPYNLNAVSQAVASLAYTDLAPAIERITNDVVRERERISRALNAHDGVRVYASQANFVWIETPVLSEHLHAAILKEGVLVRSFHAHGPRLSHALRITVGTQAQNDLFLTAFDRALQTLSGPSRHA